MVGVPGRIVKRENETIPRESMDQIHLPDPIKEDIQNLQRANSELTNRLLDMENEIRQLKKDRQNQERQKNNETL